MKTIKPIQFLDDYSLIEFVTTKTFVTVGRGLYAYLISVADVAVALFVLISVCSGSLVALYSALGVL
jgi:hypothetical protein